MNRPLFGPAGNSDSFTRQYKASVYAPRWLRELGLDWLEVCLEEPGSELLAYETKGEAQG